MDLRQITAQFAVAPQITPEDVPALAALGYRTLINNRPDNEVDDEIDAAAMAQAAAAVGMTYHHLPYFPGRMTPDLVEEFTRVLAASQVPVLAYCRSGTRSSYLWAMAVAERMPVAEILKLTSAAGYDLSGLAPMLRERGGPA